MKEIDNLTSYSDFIYKINNDYVYEYVLILVALFYVYLSDKSVSL